jgi:hypothetical protein
MLLKAYQSMRASDFELFLQFFGEQERNVNARDRGGRSVLEIVEQHRRGEEYATALRTAGAQ